MASMPPGATATKLFEIHAFSIVDEARVPFERPYKYSGNIDIVSAQPTTPSFIDAQADAI